MEVSISVDLETCVCSKCGIVYGVPDNFKRARREDHHSFWCPNGHSQYIPAKSEAEKLRARLEEEQSKLANLQLELMVKEKESKRLKSRIKNGACPCCHRQFVQLSRHMKTKHPDYAEK